MPDIAELIGDLIGAQDDLGVTDCVLTKTMFGNRVDGSLASGRAPTPTPYGARGLRDGVGRFMDGTRVREKHVKIDLYGATISGGAVPEAGDTIAIGDRTFTVERVVFDTVGAVYECEAR